MPHKVLFICHGNICRSPMAEFIFKDMVNRRALTNTFTQVESRAVSTEETGHPVYPPARAELARHGISCEGHAARQITRRDFETFDLIYVMDSSNLRLLSRLLGQDYAARVQPLLPDRDIADPWYTGDFTTTYRDIVEGCERILQDSIELSAQEKIVFDFLDKCGIKYECYHHPESPTIEIAKQYWRQDGSVHCKNLFFRNHKGNRHYLVCFDCDKDLAIHDLEHRLHQGKLSFASEQRMDKYLGLKPGSVSPFGLINDTEHHVHLFLDANLQHAETLSFHPNDSRATVVISRPEFERYLAIVGNTYEYLELY